MRSAKKHLIFALVIALIGCGESKKDDAGKTPSLNLPVTLSATPDKTDLVCNSLVNVRYVWTTAADFIAPQEELFAKVHFVDPEGRVLWQDDHPVSPSPSDWKPGTKYEYDRLIYIPLIHRASQVFMDAGLYSRSKTIRCYLEGKPVTKDNYRLATLNVTPPSKADDLPGARIEYADGWYEQERDAKTKTSWRWMADKSVCHLKNPQREAQLYIKGWAPTQVVKSKSVLTIYFAGKELKKIPDIDTNFEILIPIKQEMFENQESAELRIETSQSYVPSEIGSSMDNRRLGAMIRILYFN